MDRIRQLIAIARRRQKLRLFVADLGNGLVAAAILGVLLVLFAKFAPQSAFASENAPRGWAFVAILAAAVALTVIILMVLRAFRGVHAQVASDELQALAIDRELKLDERLVSALHLERSQDAFARAAVADAVEVASKPEMPAKVRAAFPVPIAQRAWWSLAAIAAAVAAYLYAPRYEWPAEEVPPTEQARLASKKVTEIGRAHV